METLSYHLFSLVTCAACTFYEEYIPNQPINRFTSCRSSPQELIQQKIAENNFSLPEELKNVPVRSVIFPGQTRRMGSKQGEEDEGEGQGVRGREGSPDSKASARDSAITREDSARSDARSESRSSDSSAPRRPLPSKGASGGSGSQTGVRGDRVRGAYKGPIISQKVCWCWM